ncbi:TrmB family transcriptional regulator [Sporohalobacter salinus]|uniref:TrmB family transcriptional regulator n=1 Tax=Sporohalobacter salinus TaxID=1494606 RepID=UPI001960A8C0|nr:TrmB family transcriptional regulator [Sporohalobacter salinus]MBM7622674.1 sugar-specific transcriptional regulator TrmB [Sporohalobacter salinus]
MIKNREKVIDQFTNMGLTKYDAKTYITLLQYPDSTAYKISKNSDVPQSKVYEAVKNLVSKGLAVSKKENPVHYSPLPVEEFLKRYRNSVEESISFVKDNLENLQQNKIDYVWHLESENQIKNKIEEIIDEANDTLYLEIWNEQLQIFYDQLKEAEKRGVKIVLVVYNIENCDIGKVYYHQMKEMKEHANKRGKWLTIVKDEKESLFGVFKQNNNYAVWTQNESFMLLAEKFISHDIFIAEIYNKYKNNLDENFGPNLIELRKDITIS